MSEFDRYTGWRRFYRNRETTLYYVEFTYKRRSYYKIGITTQTIQSRFCGEKLPYKVLYTKVYKSGEPAYKAEQRILSKYRDHLYRGPAILKSGNSELFTKNIMKGS